MFELLGWNGLQAVVLMDIMAFSWPRNALRDSRSLWVYIDQAISEHLLYDKMSLEDQQWWESIVIIVH